MRLFCWGCYRSDVLSLRSEWLSHFRYVWKTSASASVNVNGFDEARSFKRDVTPPLEGRRSPLNLRRL